MPLSLLQTRTPEQIGDYSKPLIDVVGKGSGFIMSARSSLDEVKPEIVKVWADSKREYSAY